MRWKSMMRRGIYSQIQPFLWESTKGQGLRDKGLYLTVFPKSNSSTEWWIFMVNFASILKDRIIMVVNSQYSPPLYAMISPYNRVCHDIESQNHGGAQWFLPTECSKYLNIQINSWIILTNNIYICICGLKKLWTIFIYVFVVD